MARRYPLGVMLGITAAMRMTSTVASARFAMTV